MDFMTLPGLGTVAGAAAAVTLVTAVVKAVVPAITGRATQAVALGLSLVVLMIANTPHTAAAGLLTALNACVVFATATGIDNVLNYK